MKNYKSSSGIQRKFNESYLQFNDNSMTIQGEFNDNSSVQFNYSSKP